MAGTSYTCGEAGAYRTDQIFAVETGLSSNPAMNWRISHLDRVAPFFNRIPLPEILSETFGVGPKSQKVQAEYHRLLGRLGNELAILQEIPCEEIDKV
ncbi:MAG: hypothetical protein HYV02_00695 [Deltaproteobacteria bacterium]|nr:hypothetical protein [Deltaproteobacteria bacterium]